MSWQELQSQSVHLIQIPTCEVHTYQTGAIHLPKLEMQFRSDLFGGTILQSYFRCMQTVDTRQLSVFKTDDIQYFVIIWNK